MRMTWRDLLFMHWPVDVSELRPLIPEKLEIDTFDGTAWIGVVPFRMTDVAPRLIPSIPYMSAFPELNVRTYVTVDGKPGVWFFCLEATNPIAVRVARKWFHLPYMDAKIELSSRCPCETGKWIKYQSTRTHRDEPPARLDLEYRPIGSNFVTALDTLEAFLTARYCLYSADARGNIFRGEIDHPPWVLREGQAIVNENTMTNWLGISLPDTPPVLHFAKSTKVKAWSLQKLRS